MGEERTDQGSSQQVPEAARVALVVAVWALFALMMWAYLNNPVDQYGFLGGTGAALAAFAVPVLATGVILTAGRSGAATAALAVGLACAAGLLGANHAQASSGFVDMAAYDWEVAREVSRSEAGGNLAHGYDQYRPFASNLIARLDGESELRFGAGERLPRVDSATALLPLAAALVTATYPEEATTVSWDAEAYAGGFSDGYHDGYDAGFVEGGGEVDEGRGEVRGYDGGGLTGTRRDGYDRGYGLGHDDGVATGGSGAEWHGEAYYDGMSAYKRWLQADEPDPGAASRAGDEPATFQYNNSLEGFTELAEGRTDVFFGTKADSDQEEHARSLGVEFDYAPVGRDGFVFLVNASNPVESLTLEQVRGIYSGRIANWSEVGGADEPITAYQRNGNSGSQSMMERFMGDEPLADAPEAVAISTMGGLVREVADYDNGKGAIGYSFRYYVTDLVGDYDVKLLEVEGVAPTLENISSGEYPVTGDFYAVTREGDEDPNLRRLIEWARGDQGQELVEKSGYARLR